MATGRARQISFDSRGSRPSLLGGGDDSSAFFDPNTLSTPLRTELLEYRVNMIEATQRHRAATMLLIGTIFGFCGFLFAFVLGMIKSMPSLLEKVDSTRGSYCRRYDGMDLDPCYFPSTVSEMVHDSSNPTGKIFYFFEFTGATLIFFSYYPYSLRCVYVGD